MTPYFAVILLSLISYCIPSLRNSHNWYRIYLCILCLFLCFGYMCGSDWRQYENMYDNIDFKNVFYGYYAEPGFLFYMVFSRFLHIDFWTFSILTKIVQFSIIAILINRYAPEYKYIVWMFFLPKSGFYMFIDYPMRNMIAVALFLVGVRYIFSKDFVRYFACVIGAMTFHFSAIIAIPLYFLLNKNISTKVYAICFVVIFTLFSHADIFEYILVKSSGLSPYVLKQVEYYIMGDTFDGEGSLISVGMFLQVLFFICLLKYRKSIQARKYGLIILNGALIYILLYRLGLTISIFSRFQLYVVVFYAIGIVYLLRIFTPSSRIIAIFMLCVLSCFSGYKDIRRDGWKYVPYTNYIGYLITNDLKPYSYRDDYNKMMTPYKESIQK